jgi:hypothetical protein
MLPGLCAHIERHAARAISFLHVTEIIAANAKDVLSGSGSGRKQLQFGNWPGSGRRSDGCSNCLQCTGTALDNILKIGNPGNAQRREIDNGVLHDNACPSGIRFRKRYETHATPPKR